MDNQKFGKLKKISGSRNLLWVVCIFCLLIAFYVVSSGVFPTKNPLIGHDASYHYLRMEALADRLRSGEIVSGGIDYLFYDGLGYASSLAYPDVFLYIPAVLRLMGVGIGTSMAVFLIFCNACCMFSMFYCIYRMSENPVAATIATVIFTTSFYRIDNLYTRFALGEVQAFIFWPIIIYGLYDLIFRDFKKPYIIGFGFVGMLLTHTLSTALAVVVCVVVVLIFAKRLLKEPKKIIRLVITALCVLVVTSFYWIPLLELMNSCELTVSHPISKASDNSVKFFGIFRDTSIGYDVAGLGILIFALCITRVFIQVKALSNEDTGKKNKVCEKNLVLFADACLFTGLLFAFLSTKSAPWGILAHVFDFIQFAWRMFAVVTVMLSVAVAVYLYIILKNIKSSEVATIIFTLMMVININVHIETIGIRHAEVYNDDYYTSDVNRTYNIGYGEWLPWSAKNITDKVKENAHRVVLNDGTEAKYQKEDTYLAFIVDDKTYEYADVPYIWYKGYVAYDEGGNEYRTSMSDMGFVRVEFDGVKPEGNIYVEYQLTTLQIVSYTVSIVSVVALIGFGIFTKMRSSKKSKEDNSEQVKEGA